MEGVSFFVKFYVRFYPFVRHEKDSVVADCKITSFFIISKFMLKSTLFSGGNAATYFSTLIPTEKVSVPLPSFIHSWMRMVVCLGGVVLRALKI